MKRCPDCGAWKPASEFPRNRRAKDGRHAYCKPCHNARCQETKARLYGGSRHYHLMHRYGMGAGQVLELVQRQGGVCAICGKQDPEHVDHDHETNSVRGVLCFNCNGGLGQFRDRPDLLLRALEYLEAEEIPRNAGGQLVDAARARAFALRNAAA